MKMVANWRLAVFGMLTNYERKAYFSTCKDTLKSTEYVQYIMTTSYMPGNKMVAWKPELRAN